MEKRKKKEENKREQSESRKGKSIHIRPTIVDENKEFGHWEMDCVEGSKEEDEIYLTLLERITKKYIVVKMPDKTNNSVVEAWNNIEKRYSKYFKYVFKTVTTDNGSNFLNYTKIESSINGNTKRFEIYYADPYSAWQKGMNENCNGILRRFIPKGTRIQSVSKYELDIIQYRINEKPRKINGFRSAEELFKEQLSYIMV